jgi:acetylornithine deacetylase/succinyl-diaminopimelate desuccinylase-like protein
MTKLMTEYTKLLGQFVKFKSVSTDPKYLREVGATVLWLKNLFNTNGFKTEVWKGKNSNPIVFAQPKKMINSLPTVLIYGHYDVQPGEKKDGWGSDPFSLRMGKVKFFGRGVVDNKGQILTHIVNVIDLLRSNALKFNVKFIIEGNEETGNPDIAGLMRKNKKKLACDLLLVSDGELTNNGPTIEVSLRGGFNCTLTYKTGKNNLHSGLAGGAVPNAAIEIARFLDKLFSRDNIIGYKDFYKDVDKVSPSQLENNKYLSKHGVNPAKLLGVNTLLTEKNTDFYTQTGLRPTIQVSGIKTGYIDSGYANIVPAQAEVRLNFRIVSSQKAGKVRDDFAKFVAANTPKYVNYSLKFGGLHDPVKIDTQNQYVKTAESILTKVYGSRVNRRNVGGAIPFVGDVKTILGVDTLLIPLANEDCNMHGANENYDIKLIEKALEFSREFLGKS